MIQDSVNEKNYHCNGTKNCDVIVEYCCETVRHCDGTVTCCDAKGNNVKGD